MLRLFIALDFPDELRQRLGAVISDAKDYCEGIKWVSPENIHLTLKFLGETPEDMVSAITGGIEMAISDRAAYNVSVTGFGGFPNLRKPRVVWAGITGEKAIIETAHMVNTELTRIGIPADAKRLSPHITLGRVKRPGDFTRLISYFESLNFSSSPYILDRIRLVQSTLTQSGPIYKNVKEFKLQNT